MTAQQGQRAVVWFAVGGEFVGTVVKMPKHWILAEGKVFVLGERSDCPISVPVEQIYGHTRAEAEAYRRTWGEAPPQEWAPTVAPDRA